MKQLVQLYAVLLHHIHLPFLDQLVVQCLLIPSAALPAHTHMHVTKLILVIKLTGMKEDMKGFAVLLCFRLKIFKGLVYTVSVGMFFLPKGQGFSWMNPQVFGQSQSPKEELHMQKHLFSHPQFHA